MRRIAVAASLLFLILPGSGRGQDAPGGPAAPAAPAAPPAKPPEPRLAKDPKIRAAVQNGLDWLARHQADDGRWDAEGFPSRCKGKACEGAGHPLYDVGVTGLALRAFSAGGHTVKTQAFGPAIRRGLEFLRAVQDKEGCFGTRISPHFVYNHAAATLAWNEIYRDSRDPLFEEAARKATAFSLACRNPDKAWRYGIQPQENDTSVTGWMVSGIAAARAAGIEVDPRAFEGALAWVDLITDPGSGRAGYTNRGNGPARPQELMDLFPPGRTESLTAVALHTRILCGQKPDQPVVVKGLALLRNVLPVWDRTGGVDLYYWLFGTAACRAAADDALWARWRPAAATALLAGQRGPKDDCARGSWDPVDPWARDGGRIYATAMAVVTLAECDRREVKAPRK